MGWPGPAAWPLIGRQLAYTTHQPMRGRNDITAARPVTDLQSHNTHYFHMNNIDLFAFYETNNPSWQDIMIKYESLDHLPLIDVSHKGKQ